MSQSLQCERRGKGTGHSGDMRVKGRAVCLEGGNMDVRQPGVLAG